MPSNATPSDANDQPGVLGTKSDEMPVAERIWNWGVLAAIVVLTCLSIYYRSFTINESLWLDELHTSWCVSGGIADVWPRAWLGNNSPLYFYATWAVTKLFGQSEWSLRLISLVSGVALTPTVFLIVWSWTGRRTAGFAAAALVAVEGNNLFFSSEARPYALVQWLGAVHIWLTWKVLQDDRWYFRASWIVLAVGLFYLHYTAALLLLAEAIVVLLLTIVAIVPWRTLLPRIIDGVVVLLAALASWSQLVDIASRRENWQQFIRKQPFREVLNVFELSSTIYLSAGIALAAIVICLLASVFTKRKLNWGRTPKQQFTSFAIATAWLFVPIVAAWLSTKHDFAALFMRRYVIASGTATAVLAGLFVATCPNRWLRMIFALIVVTSATLSTGPFVFDRAARMIYFEPSRHSPQDWRAATQRLLNELESQPKAVVFVRSGLIEANESLNEVDADSNLAEYCSLPVRCLYKVPDGTVIYPMKTNSTDNLSPTQLDAIYEHGEAWFVMLDGFNEAEKAVRRVADRVQRRMPREQVFQLNSADVGPNWVSLVRLRVRDQP